MQAIYFPSFLAVLPGPPGPALSQTGIPIFPRSHRLIPSCYLTSNIKIWKICHRTKLNRVFSEIICDMTGNKCKVRRINLQEIFGADKDSFKELLREVLQEVLEQEMTEAIGAEKGERSVGRLGYRSGYYGRALVTRVGRLSYGFPRTGRDIFPPRFLRGIKGRRKRWFRPWPRCTSRGCPPGR